MLGERTDGNGYVGIYNTIREIESTFRCLKTDLDVRPIYHQKDENSEAHLFIGIVAYQLAHGIRK
jgi:transposase